MSPQKLNIKNDAYPHHSSMQWQYSSTASNIHAYMLWHAHSTHAHNGSRSNRQHSSCQWVNLPTDEVTDMPTTKSNCHIRNFRSLCHSFSELTSLAVTWPVGKLVRRSGVDPMCFSGSGPTHFFRSWVRIGTGPTHFLSWIVYYCVCIQLLST